MKERAFDLEERLIIFAVDLIRMVELLPNSSAGNHIRNQKMRSGTSPAANYGEAQSAESRADFTHKLKIILKELRETRVWLLMIRKADFIKPVIALDALLQGNCSGSQKSEFRRQNS